MYAVVCVRGGLVNHGIVHVINLLHKQQALGNVYLHSNQMLEYKREGDLTGKCNTLLGVTHYTLLKINKANINVYALRSEFVNNVHNYRVSFE